MPRIRKPVRRTVPKLRKPRRSTGKMRRPGLKVFKKGYQSCVPYYVRKHFVKELSKMPIYEFECPNHGVLELYFHKYNVEDEIICPVGEMFDKEDPCIAVRLWSIPIMRPDKYWAGHIVNGSYVTSQAEVSAIMDGIEPATRENVEYTQKAKDRRMKEWNEKRAKDLSVCLTEEFRGIDDTTFAPDKGESISTYEEYNRQKNAWLSKQ